MGDNNNELKIGVKFTADTKAGEQSNAVLAQTKTAADSAAAA